MKENVLVRSGFPGDIPYVLDLVKELARYEKAPDEVEATENEMLKWGFGREKLFDFYVLEKAGEIIGTAIFYYKYSTWKGRCLFLEDIIVTEKQRRRGYGGLLFKKIIQRSKTDGVKRLEWQVLEWNTPALTFYEKYKCTFDKEWINCRLTFQQLQSDK